MKLRAIIVFVFVLIFNLANAQNSYWTKTDLSLSKEELKKSNITSKNNAVYLLDETLFKNSLNKTKTSVVFFPDKNGVMIAFNVEEKNNMAPELAIKYPSIKSYRGFAASDDKIHISFSLSSNGIAVLITDPRTPESVSLNNLSKNKYLLAVSKNDTNIMKDLNCFKDGATTPKNDLLTQTSKSSLNKSSQTQTITGIRKLNLAIVAPGEFSEMNGGTLTSVLASINTVINDLNSVSEVDLGVVYVLIAEEEKLIFLDKTTDPYDIETYGVNFSSSYLNTTTQHIIDTNIAFNSYDIGHLFISRNEVPLNEYGVGNAYTIGSVGSTQKGTGWSYYSTFTEGKTGFVKLVLHELGHQLGANHTFSHLLEGTGVNSEVFTGRSIMGYGPTNLYYHYNSIKQIRNNFELNPFSVSLGTIPIPFSDSFPTQVLPIHYIPVATPFYLQVPVMPLQASYSFNWEQLDNGVTDVIHWGPGLLRGSVFCSTNPKQGDGSRYFPSMNLILDGNLTNNNDTFWNRYPDLMTANSFETLSNVARTYTFGLSLRDPGLNKEVSLNTSTVVVVENTSAFNISSVIANQSFTAGTPFELKWNVGNTDKSPISTEKVDILLSIDNGLTFPYVLAKNTNNDGSQIISFPNIQTNVARLKIQPTNNIYFSITKEVFSIQTSKSIVFFDNLEQDLNFCNATNTLGTSFDYQTAAGFLETSTITVSAMPVGISYTLGQTQVSASNTKIPLSFQIDDSAIGGQYPITITTTAASSIASTTLFLNIFKPTFPVTNLVSPVNNAVGISQTISLNWQANPNARRYHLQVSKNPVFTDILVDIVNFGTSFDLANLDSETTYYWHIAAVNDCSEGAYSVSSNFTTLKTFYQEFSIVSHLKPIEIPNGVTNYVISITDDVLLADLNVFTSITNSSSRAIKLELTNPSGTKITLTDGINVTEPIVTHINCEFDDAAIDKAIVASPTINVQYKPKEALSQFNSTSVKGDWVLTVTNNHNVISQLNDFSLKIKAKSIYYAPFANDLTKITFGSEKTPVLLSATNSVGAPISGFSVIITRLPDNGVVRDATTDIVLKLYDEVPLNSVVYQANPGFFGKDYFYYAIKYQNVASRSAIVTMNCIGAYTAPKPKPVWLATLTNNPVIVPLTVENLIFTEIATYSYSSPQHGSLSELNGVLVYTPAQNFAGIDTFNYTVDDGKSTASETITIKVFGSYKTNILAPEFKIAYANNDPSNNPMGSIISVNGDGTVFATSEEFKDVFMNVNNTYAGMVQVYHKDVNTGIWSQLGNDILGIVPGEQFGNPMSLSSDGKKLAVGTQKVVNIGPFSTTDDYVKTFVYNPATNHWDVIGQTLIFSGGGSNVDLSLDLNADGSIMAIGNARKSLSTGGITIYKFNVILNQWEPLANSLDGEKMNVPACFGGSVTLNHAGNILATSQGDDIYLSEYGSDNPGKFKIYQFDGSSWGQKGSDIEPLPGITGYGNAIAMDYTGTVIAIGLSQSELRAPYSKSGKVFIYTFNALTNEWQAKGQVLNGEFAGSRFGFSVSMDGTGDLLAVGAPGTDLGAFAKNGSVTIYRYNKQNGSWEKQNFTSNAGKFMDPNYNNFGDKVSLSGNGTTLISSYGWFEPTKSYNYVYNLVNYAPIAANYAPIAVADQITVAEGGTITTLLGGGTSLLANDTDAENNPLTAIVVTNPINGILTLNSNGTFNYVHNGSETISDSFTYKANDGNSNSNIVTVTITINPVNDAPIAVADQITVAEGGTTTTLVGGINNVLTNDTDSENNALTAKLVSGVTNGILTLNSNGTFSYVHNGSETTSDSFTYKANDGALDSNTVTVIITITPVNDAPIAVADQVLVLKGGTSTTLVGGATSVLTNDTDAENNKLTASLVSGVTSGTLTLNADGTFSYVHNDSGTTFDSFTYKANDGTLNSNVVTVTITIIPSFTLPSTNFSIQVKDETCITKSNGEINITAVESYGYVATVNGKSYNFVNNSLTVSNQPPGTYSICISIPGKIFEQCFTAIVSKGKTITGKLRAATNKVSVEIVEGTAPFQIFVNGKEQFETELTTFSVVVKKGDLLEVKTAKSCEGIYSKGIGDLLGAITLYPNPTSGSFEINLPTSRKEVVIDLYTAASQLISKRTYPIENERVQLNLGNEPSGVYIVKIYLDTPENLTIIKN